MTIKIEGLSVDITEEEVKELLAINVDIKQITLKKVAYITLENPEDEAALVQQLFSKKELWQTFEVTPESKEGPEGGGGSQSGREPESKEGNQGGSGSQSGQATPSKKGP